MNKRILISFTIIVTLIIIIFYYSPLTISFSIYHLFLGILVGIGIWILCYFIIKIINEKQKINSETLRHKIKDDYLNMTDFSYLFFKLYPNTILEEILFRSHIFLFTNMYLPIGISILINAILFTLVHRDKRIIQLSISSIIYCLLVVFTNNILPSILAHLTYNTIVHFTRNKLKKSTI